MPYPNMDPTVPEFMPLAEETAFTEQQWGKKGQCEGLEEWATKDVPYVGMRVTEGRIDRRYNSKALKHVLVSHQT